MQKHGINFATLEEYEFRYSLYLEKHAEIQKINSDPAHSFTVGHNIFSTWTKEEYAALIGENKIEHDPSNVKVMAFKEIPSNLDWRTKGAVTPVQNQIGGRGCSANWAFAATASVEGHHAIQTGSLLKLSESEIIDCDTNSQGCKGGDAKSALILLGQDYSELEANYPYKP